MERDYSKLGVFNVDGQWATNIRYEVTQADGQIKEVRLQFLNGRHQVAAATLDADAAREVLGEKNFAAITRAVERQAEKGVEPAGGDLRGRQLEYRQATLHGQPPNSIEEQARRLRAGPEDDPWPHRDPLPGQQPQKADAVPNWVKDRFLVVDNRYHFPDHTLAFTDQGRKLKSETDNAEVVRSLVAIAEAREWQALKVRGSEAFRRQVWREAQRRNIEVEGYEPTAVEVAEVKRLAERDADAKTQSGEQPVPTPMKSPNATTDGARSTDARPARQVLMGRLVESGAAPYRFEPTAAMSYYVKVQTEHGERTLWGVDLERAMAESRTKPKPGDTIGIENQGSKPVTVKSLQRDADGNTTDTTITTHRNRWLVERPVYFDERAERAAAFANGEAAKRELAQRYPDLTGALVGLWLGEQFAAKMIERPEDRERLVGLVKERLREALERGETISAPKLRQEVGQRLEAVADDFDEIGQRARARAARRGGRQRGPAAEREAPEVPPQVLA